MTIIAIILLLTPTAWHLWSDKDGDAKEDKATDILIVIAIAFTASAVGWMLGQRMLDSLLLAWAIHFFAFDYLINIILYRRHVIETNDWFERLGNGPVDRLMKKLKPWPRFWVRLGALIVAIVIYAISI